MGGNDPFETLPTADRAALEAVAKRLGAGAGEDELRALLRELVTINDTQARALRRIGEAFGTPLEQSLNPASEMVDDTFAAEFQTRIQTHHALITEPLSRLEFEAAFCAAADAAGRTVEPAPPGTRFWDARVDGAQLSLKATAARNLRVNTLHISKLTEAAWIQDCRSAATRRARTHKLFKEYTASVASIWQLRFFRDKRLYELVEIPVPLIQPILDTPNSAFQADGPQVPVPVDTDPPDLYVRLDRSDAKVMLEKIQKSSCVVHGKWELPDEGAGNEEE